MINESTPYNVIHTLAQIKFECTTIGLTPTDNRHNNRESHKLSMHVPSTLQTSASFPDTQSEKQIWHITDTDAV